MSTPEPVDEYPAAPAETRGGDRLADITATDAPASSCDCCALDDEAEDPE